MHIQVQVVEHPNAIILTPPNLNCSALETGLNRICNLRKVRFTCFKIG